MLVCRISTRFHRVACAPRAAGALTTNPALLTAWSHDAGYDDAFARALGLRTVGLTSFPGGSMREHGDVLMAAAATETPRIQERHLVTYHPICAALEQRLFGGGA